MAETEDILCYESYHVSIQSVFTTELDLRTAVRPGRNKPARGFNRYMISVKFDSLLSPVGEKIYHHCTADVLL